jgi:hypothetical protein
VSVAIAHRLGNWSRISNAQTGAELRRRLHDLASG